MRIGANPNLAAALLIADGDRIPDDTTVNIGSASPDPEKTGGAAQDWPILAHAPAKLPANIGVRTISVCDAGDAVCDYDPDADEVSPTAVAIHTSYTARRATGRCGPGWSTNSSARRHRRRHRTPHRGSHHHVPNSASTSACWR